MPEPISEQGEHEKEMARESLRYVTGESQESHPSTTRENCLGPIILWYTKPGALPRHDTRSTNTFLSGRTTGDRLEQLSPGSTQTTCRRIPAKTRVRTRGNSTTGFLGADGEIRIQAEVLKTSIYSTVHSYQQGCIETIYLI